MRKNGNGKSKKSSKGRRSKNPKKLLEREVLVLWGKVVRERDRHLCRICLSLGHERAGTSAHHIYGKKAYPGIKFLLSNGITGCYYHHIRVAHEKPEEFRDWLISEIGEDSFEQLKKMANAPYTGKKDLVRIHAELTVALEHYVRRNNGERGHAREENAGMQA